MIRRKDDSGLGRTQTLVLHLLAEQPKSVRTLGGDWPGLTESAVRGAIERLGDRGLVDCADWGDEGRRRYCLTGRGDEIERQLVELHDDHR